MFPEPSVRARLLQLKAQKSELADRLDADAGNLESRGTPPTQHLIDDLTSFRRQLLELARLVHPDAEEDDNRSLLDIEREIRQAAESQPAIQELDRFLSLRAAGTELPTLIEHQTRAQELRAAILDATDDSILPERQRLAEGQHPWARLSRLVLEPESVSDDDWTAWTEDIRNELGPTVARAAARGALVSDAAPASANAKARLSAPPADLSGIEIDPPADTVTESAASSHDIVTDHPARPDEAAERTAIPSVHDAPPAPDQPADESDDPAQLEETIFGDDDGPASMRSDSSHRPLVSPLNDDDRSLTTSGAAKETSSEPSRDVSFEGYREQFTPAEGPVAQTAERALAASPQERNALLAHLILHLICEGRAGLAYHLAQSAAPDAPGARRILPPWLIRAWTLGHMVLYSRGQFAGLLEDDFAQFDASHINNADEEWATALGLLVRAAALRPAVVAPGTRVGPIIRSFPIQHGCVQLYNYCSRIGSYGEKLQGLSPAAFKRSQDQRPWEQRLENLQSRVHEWRERTSQAAFVYQSVTPLFLHAHWSLRSGSAQRHPEEAALWSAWQQIYQTADAILIPVLEDRWSDVAAVKSEMERLTAQIADDEYSPGGIRGHRIPIDTMRSHLRQAITFGQEWVALHSDRGSSQGFLPEEAESLQYEVLSRHDAVVAELDELVDRFQSFEVETSVACLLLSMQQLRDLFDPDTPTEASEPDHRHLLHAELLKVRGLHLTSQWEPEAAPADLERRILEYLTEPSPDWLTAFHLQMSDGNFDAARKLTQLDVWSPVEREKLQQIVDQRVQDERTRLQHELAETETLIEDAIRLELLSPHDHAGFTSRLEQLRIGIDKMSDLRAGSREVDSLRQAVQERRERETNQVRRRLEELDPHNPSDEANDRPNDWIMDFSPDS